MSSEPAIRPTTLAEKNAQIAAKVRALRARRQQGRQQHPSPLNLGAVYLRNREERRQRKWAAVNFQRERNALRQRKQSFEILMQTKRLIMPIIGMTDKNDVELFEALPRLGKLRKGGKKPISGKAPGQDLDYFRVDFEPEYARLTTNFTDLYGDEPTIFEDVFMAGETVADAFPTWMEDYTATTLLHRCDGQNQVTHWQDGAYSHDTIPCVRTLGQTCQCKQTGKLRIILRDLFEETGVFGWFEVVTHSKHDIIHLHSMLHWVGRRAGSLALVPFVLGRSPREITRPSGNGKRAKTTKSLLYLYVAPDYMQGVLLGAGQGDPALTAPDHAPLAIEAGNSVETVSPDTDPEQGDALTRLAEIDPLPPGPEGGSKIEETGEDTGGHWTKTQRLSDFITWTLEQSLSLKDTQAALGVSALKDYTGTEKEAADAVRAFVAQKIDGPEPDDDPLNDDASDTGDATEAESPKQPALLDLPEQDTTYQE